MGSILPYRTSKATGLRPSWRALSSWLALMLCFAPLCLRATQNAPRPNASAAHGDPATRWLLLDAALTGNTVFTVGERGVILRSVDSGYTWIRCQAPAGETLTGICFAPDGKHGWAVGHNARILSTTDGGLSWKINYTHTGTEASLLDVACISATRVIAIGAFGLALESRDSGSSWSPLNLPSSDRHLNKIQASTQGQVYIAGESGLLLRSIDVGETWEALPSPYEGSYYGILPLSSGALLAHGLRGNLLLSPSAHNGAISRELPSWERLQITQSGLLATALQTRSGAILVAGQARVFLISRDGGASFSPWTSGITSAVAELLETPDGTLLAFGENGVSILTPP